MGQLNQELFFESVTYILWPFNSKLAVSQYWKITFLIVKIKIIVIILSYIFISLFLSLPPCVSLSYYYTYSLSVSLFSPLRSFSGT